MLQTGIYVESSIGTISYCMVNGQYAGTGSNLTLQPNDNTTGGTDEATCYQSYIVIRADRVAGVVQNQLNLSGNGFVQFSVPAPDVTINQ